MGDRLRLADLLGGLSTVADMGFGLPPQTAMRSCLVSAALARRLDLGEPEVADAFYGSLLLHVGCITVAHEAAALFGDELVLRRALATTNYADPADIERTLIPAVTRGLPRSRRQELSQRITTDGPAFGRYEDTASCEVGRDTARRLELPESTQTVLHQMFEWFDGGGVQGRAGDDIPPAARVARVASDAVVFGGIGGPDLAVDALRRRAGVLLDPEVVEGFCADAGDFLAEAMTGEPRQRIIAVEPLPVVERDQAELPAIAAAFADLADMKSPFTQGHSRHVARLASGAAQRLRLDTRTAVDLHVAALLHDVGKVGVTALIWDKAGPLTLAEWEQVRMHSYYSERILATSPTLAPVARLAGATHERQDGSGYHRGTTANDSTLAARVLAAADTLSALTQRRPHRPAFEADAAAEVLAQEGRAGRLDPDAVAAVLEAAGGARPRRMADLRPGGLSDREIEVLRLVAEGHSNPAIAERLHISRRTAEHHVQHIYAKIGVSSRPGAALFASQHDLLGPPDT